MRHKYFGNRKIYNYYVKKIVCEMCGSDDICRRRHDYYECNKCGNILNIDEWFCKEKKNKKINKSFVKNVAKRREYE